MGLVLLRSHLDLKARDPGARFLQGLQKTAALACKRTPSGTGEEWA